MAFEVHINKLEDFTSIKITGPASLPDFVQMIVTMGEKTRKDGVKRVLVDLLGVDGEMKFTEHFQIGEAVAMHMRHLDRLASVVPEDRITRTSEKVAVSQGMQLRVFTSMNEAIRWLCDAPPRSASLSTGRARQGA
jgi:hypothetical protein